MAVQIDPQAEPFFADGHGSRARSGLLLVHGFTGSPYSMRPWAEHLREHGYRVAVPLLPGHGTSWKELARTTWQDWYAAAEHALTTLARECERVYVCGLSMGGGLSLHLAAHHDTTVSGLALVNPSVASRDKKMAAVPLLKRVVPSIPGVANDIKKPGVDEHGYRRVPLRAVDSLRAMWKATPELLPQITAPLMLFRSRVDHVVDPSGADLIMTRVSSRDVHERMLDDSFHVATLDNDAPAIFAESADFFDRLESAYA